MTKRIITLLMSFVILFSLTACSNKTTSSKVEGNNVTVEFSKSLLKITSQDLNGFKEKLKPAEDYYTEISESDGAVKLKVSDSQKENLRKYLDNYRKGIIEEYSKLGNGYKIEFGEKPNAAKVYLDMSFPMNPFIKSIADIFYQAGIEQSLDGTKLSDEKYKIDLININTGNLIKSLDTYKKIEFNLDDWRASLDPSSTMLVIYGDTTKKFGLEAKNVFDVLKHMKDKFLTLDNSNDASVTISYKKSDIDKLKSTFIEASLALKNGFEKEFPGYKINYSEDLKNIELFYDDKIDDVKIKSSAQLMTLYSLIYQSLGNPTTDNTKVNITIFDRNNNEKKASITIPDNEKFIPLKNDWK